MSSRDYAALAVAVRGRVDCVEDATQQRLDDLAEQLRALQQRVDKLQGGELREGEPWQARHALEALWAACGDERSRDALAAVRTELVHLWAVEQHAKEYIDKTNNSNRLALTECLDRGGVLLRGTQEPQPAAPGGSNG